MDVEKRQRVRDETLDVPCSLIVLKRCGITRGTTSWHGGMGLDRASSLSLAFSFRSPAGKQ
jgi:hypothetical protein